MPTITPTTTIAALLEEWPDLEPVLIAQAPAFRNLRNPVLRRTIARIATIEQAASIAGLSPRTLVTTLRRAAGLPVDDRMGAEPPGGPAVDPGATGCARAAAGTPGVGTDASAWTTTGAGGEVIDADALLGAGAVPLKPIFDAAGRLQPGQVLRVLVSFRPLPLIERLESHGYRCQMVEDAGARQVLLVHREPAASDR
jgi:hypothetical protein